MKLTRRTLLGSGAAGLAAALAGVPSPGTAGFLPKQRKIKNVIFCVVDGMPASVMTIVDHYYDVVLGKRSYWSSLLEQPGVVLGLQDTRSLSSIVTDSSAASSTWGCGRRIWNGQTNVYPDGTELKTLTQVLADEKVRCGLVTTATITHATPSGFAVNSISRSLEGQIAEKYADANVDVLLGGGNKFFDPKLRPDGMDLYEKFRKKGFQVVRDRDSLTQAKPGKLLGIFSDSHIPYSVDRDYSPQLQKSVPTLAEMSLAAIKELNKSSNGFLLQIEGAKVDHGCHGNDVAAAIFDQMAFEDAVKVAIDFAKEDGETLVIITADHATGGLALNGAGSGYFDSTAGMLSLGNIQCSFSPLISQIGKTPTINDVKDAIQKNWKYEIKTAEAQAIVDTIGGNSPYKTSIFHGGVNGALGIILGNYCKVGFTSQNHTNDHVLVTAFGPGAEQMHGLTTNTDFYNIILGAFGTKHENPRMSFEDAKKAFDKAKKVDDDSLALYADLDDLERESVVI